MNYLRIFLQDVDEPCIKTPTAVEALNGSIVNSFSFCEDHSAALVLTRLLKVSFKPRMKFTLKSVRSLTMILISFNSHSVVL